MPPASVRARIVRANEVQRRLERIQNGEEPRASLIKGAKSVSDMKSVSLSAMICYQRSVRAGPGMGSPAPR